jgi:hypothetical protein
VPPEGQGDNENHHSHKSQYPDLDLNRVSAKYKSQILSIVAPTAEIFEHRRAHGVQEMNVESELEDVNRRNVLEDVVVYCGITLMRYL